MSARRPQTYTDHPRRPGRATPGPAATTTRSTRTRRSRRSVGLPGVIAHGMYTMALAARAVVDLVPRRRGRQLRLQVHQPGRRTRRRAASTIEVAGEAQVDRRRADHGRARPSPAAAQKVLGMPEGSPACLSACRAARDHTTLRLGGPAERWCGPTPRPSWSTPSRGRRRRRAGARARRRQQPGRRRRGLRRARSSRSPPAASRSTPSDGPACGGAMVTVAAGETWDDLVARAVERGWVGVEALSGIPGSVGATPIQNVGAYGQEVVQTIASVRVWDRELRGVRTFAGADCGFGYRTRRFKADPRPPRRARRDLPAPPGRPRRAGARTPSWPAPSASSSASGRRWPTSATRCWGCARGKGMVLDPADHDTWSAGSFFTNPVLDADAPCPTGAPALAAAGRPRQDQRRLADRARRLRQGLRQRPRSRSPTKHTLALTNRGGATHRRPARARPRGARRRRASVRHPAGQRAGAGRLRALVPLQVRSKASMPEVVLLARDDHDDQPDDQADHAEDQQHRADDAHDPAGVGLAAAAVACPVDASISSHGLAADPPGERREHRRRDAAAGCRGSADVVAEGGPSSA